MSGSIIDGKLVANQITEEIKTELRNSNIRPGLALILVGSNPASEIYVKMKEKKCERIRILFYCKQAA